MAGAGVLGALAALLVRFGLLRERPRPAVGEWGACAAGQGAHAAGRDGWPRRRPVLAPAQPSGTGRAGAAQRNRARPGDRSRRDLAARGPGRRAAQAAARRRARRGRAGDDTGRPARRARHGATGPRGPGARRHCPAPRPRGCGRGRAGRRGPAGRRARRGAGDGGAQARLVGRRPGRSDGDAAAAVRPGGARAGRQRRGRGRRRGRRRPPATADDPDGRAGGVRRRWGHRGGWSGVPGAVVLGL